MIIQVRKESVHTEHTDERVAPLLVLLLRAINN